MTSDELIEWSHAIADACLRTTIKPEEVETACAAYVRVKSGKRTNYERYFGTPEKAAETLAGIAKRCDEMDCNAAVCNDCPLGRVSCSSPACVLEWLQEECDE